MFELKTRVHGVPIQRRHILRAAADMAMAFVLFTGFAAIFACAPTSASPHILKTQPAVAASATIIAVAKPSETPTAIKIAARDHEVGMTATVAMTSRNAPDRSHVLLALAFSLLAALNLAFVRHLRRAYVSPRRSARKAMR